MIRFGSRTSVANLVLGVGILMAAGSVFAASSIYDFTLNSIDGKPAPLATYKGKVVLLVNVARSAATRRNIRRSKRSTRNIKTKAS